MGKRKTEAVDRPRLTVLEPYVEFFPAMIARSQVARFTGGAISAKTVEKDELRKQGPRLWLYINGKKVYPILYFLEYLERKGVTVGMLDPLLQGPSRAASGHTDADSAQ